MVPPIQIKEANSHNMRRSTPNKGCEAIGAKAVISGVIGSQGLDGGEEGALVA